MSFFDCEVVAKNGFDRSKNKICESDFHFTALTENDNQEV
jgi:hypothetical protein